MQSRALLSSAFRQCGPKRRRMNVGHHHYATEATSNKVRPAESLHQGRSYGQPMPLTHPHLFKDSSELTPGIPKSEYESRRRKLMERLPDNSTVICCGNRLHYKFRQATDFYYLTGFTEPDACVVLHKNSSSRGYRMRFFCRANDIDREKWEGPRTGMDGAVEVFGADDAEDIDSLAAYLSSVVANASGPLFLDLPPDSAASRASTRRVRGHANARSIIDFFRNTHRQSTLNMLSLGKRRVDIETLTDQLRSSAMTQPLAPRIEESRLIKSPNEVALMRKAAEISAGAHAKVMRFGRPNMNESQLVAHFEYTTSSKGSERLAYVPVCASHDSALTIHYTSNDRLVPHGSLVLLDAGCEYQGYASDITRTWPIDGKFSSPQRDLYQAVLNATTACIKLCSESQGYTLNDLHRRSTDLLRSELRQIGFSSLDNTLMESKLYPHFVTHPLGMDLHDTPSFDRSERLRAGMVITIEPGIYVPYHSAFNKHFQGLGVRVEDEILVERDDYVVLSANCPREVVDVESTCMGVLE